MKRTFKTAAKNTIAGLTAAGALLSAGGNERPPITDAEKVEAIQTMSPAKKAEAVRNDQDALLRHMGACSITGVEEIKGKDYIDDSGYPRNTLKVHLKTEETLQAKFARNREKVLKGVAEFPMQFRAYARNPSDAGKQNFAAVVPASEQFWKSEEPLNDDINVYPIKLGTEMSPANKKVIDLYAENTVFVAPEYEEQGLVDARSREYCGTFQGTLNPETGKTEWAPVPQEEQFPDQIFYNQK